MVDSQEMFNAGPFPEDQLSESQSLIRVPLELSGPAVARGYLQPVHVGVPLPKGQLMQPGSAVLTDGQNCVPVQIQAMNYWSDGSIRWLLMDALLSDEDQMESSWLELSSSGRHSCTQPIQLRENSTSIEIETNAAHFAIDRSQLSPFDVLHTDRQKQCCSRISFTDHHGGVHQPDCIEWRIETDGPLRATLVGQGRFRTSRDLRVALRLDFYAGTGLVRLEVTLHNPDRAKHAGGLWDLGDRGSVFFEELSVEFDLLQPSHRFSWSLALDDSEASSRNSLQNWSIYQDSSGGVNWNSLTHVNHKGKVPSRFRGYQLKVDDTVSSGRRPCPALSIHHTGGQISLAVPEFWQQFPTAISFEEKTVRVGLFPREYQGPFELQGGEQKTHTIWLEFADGRSSHTGKDELLRWVHQPLALRPSPEWCDESQALPGLCGLEPQTTQKFDTLLEESLQCLLENRERVDEYSWRNYGDVFADHEQTYYEGTKPLVSHYNNQFDMVYGFLLQYLRTGQSCWFEQADVLARHVIDIDIYRTTADRAAYNGGLFWFTDHYLHAGTSTHRTYTAENCRPGQPYGGGPGAEHNFTSGLLLYYCLTGNSNARDTVIGLADWVINMDDGRQNILGILDDGPTGLASGGSGNGHQVPNRAGGNSINALLDAWLLTADRSYVDFAEQLIRRSVHPEDDIDSLNLLDIEHCWSYTVFLSNVAKYLELKQECGEIDESYTYAQVSLLHYASWMLKHELPYFDQREKMQYPTEAWAAQEFRKANVLRHAAVHADDVIRQRLLDRGDELADRAWSDLSTFDTRTHARAVAVVMTEGLLDCRFRSRRMHTAVRPEVRGGFGAPWRFVPQKRRIRESLSSPRAWPLLTWRAANPWRWVRYLQTCR